MNEALVTPEQNRDINEMLIRLAAMRQQSSEEGLMRVAQYDPNSPYHNLNIDTHPGSDAFSPQALQHMAELVLHNYDTNAYRPGTTETFERIRSSLRPQLALAKERREAGNRLMIVTAHQTRFEPAVVAFMAQAAMAETPQEHEELRKLTTVIISRYLALFEVNRGMLAGKEDEYTNMVDMAQVLGAIALSFPNTPNMRQLSGVDPAFQGQCNARLLRKILNLPEGSICVNAANGTMESLKGEVYPISEVKAGTRKLIKSNWDVVFVASALDIDEPFSIASDLIPTGEVTDELIHDGMAWIAQTLTERDVLATYAGKSVPVL